MQQQSVRVTTIPAITRPPAVGTVSTVYKKRVAAYARVSTDNEEQLTSYEAQVNHYTHYIKEKEDWEFVEIYTDEGISGTSTKHRDGFKRMIQDALEGKIDLILTKSVSRFARNTVDTLTTVRQLKEKGVEVYFEKENIYTLDSKGELLITIMSSLAQEESRSLSENVKWGKRKRFADGIVNLPYKHFLGYEKGENGRPKIVEKEAKVVRLIYQLFLEGRSISSIARHLTDKKIPTPAGKKKWSTSTVESILTNEKFKGDAKLQKRYTEDFLTKKMKVNQGEVPQYYVEGSHSGIVSSEVFDMAQKEMRERKDARRYASGDNCFSGKILCGECGSAYGSKVWHSTSKYRRIIWQCNNKFQNEHKCKTPHLYDDAIKHTFIGAFNSLIQNKEAILSEYEQILEDITDSTRLEQEQKAVDQSCLDLGAVIERFVNENAHCAQDQNEFQKRYDEYVKQYQALHDRSEELAMQITRMKERRIQIMEFLNTLRVQDTLLTEFDSTLWCSTVTSLHIQSKTEAVFTFKDGTELPWPLTED